MNDTTLLITGISVFSLMLVAVILTVLEFREMGQKPANSGLRKQARAEDRD